MTDLRFTCRDALSGDGLVVKKSKGSWSSSATQPRQDVRAFRRACLGGAASRFLRSTSGRSWSVLNSLIRSRLPGISAVGRFLLRKPQGYKDQYYEQKRALTRGVCVVGHASSGNGGCCQWLAHLLFEERTAGCCARSEAGCSSTSGHPRQEKPCPVDSVFSASQHQQYQ